MITSMMVYLKTTDTCQLDCSHCYTSGSNGKKIWFDPKKTINFINSLIEEKPELEEINIALHGGEPLICPTDKITEVFDALDLKHGDKIRWGIQTNLTFPLTPDKLEILDRVCGKHIGTSWDKDIRWKNAAQEKVWEDNVKTLIADGYQITLMVSLSKDLIETTTAKQIIDKAIGLGIQHINFERITSNGNAVSSGVVPTNTQTDEYCASMWSDTLEHKLYDKINNLFFDSILTSFVYSTFVGCRCRQCEQKVLTINADGTIGGCPNSAPDDFYANLDDDIKNVLYNEKRMCAIQSEATMPIGCLGCKVYDICNSDCHQLKWQGNVCPAPKTMMSEIKSNVDVDLYKKVLNGFVGSE